MGEREKAEKKEGNGRGAEKKGRRKQRRGGAEFFTVSATWGDPLPRGGLHQIGCNRTKQSRVKKKWGQKKKIFTFTILKSCSRQYASQKDGGVGNYQENNFL